MARRLILAALVVLVAVAFWFLLPDDGKDAAPAAPVAPPSGRSEEAGRPGPVIEVDDHDEMPVQPPESTLPATAVEPTTEDGQLIVVGRVVDRARQPVGGATVTVYVAGREREDPRATQAAQDGTFAVTVSLNDGATVMIVQARHDGAAGFVGLSLWKQEASRHDVGTISILPGGNVSVHVVDTDGAPLANVPVYLSASHGMSHAVIATATTTEDGMCSFVGVPPGIYRVIARPVGRARGVRPLRVPSLVPGPVRIEIGLARELTALVTDRNTKEPIAGATVTVEELVEVNFGNRVVPYTPPIPPLTTGADGRVSVPMIGATDKVQLLATADGYPSDSGSRMIMSHPLDKTEVEIRLAALRPVMRWPISKSEGVSPPPDGTELEIRKHAGAVARQLPSRAWVQDAHVHAADCARAFFHVDVVAPDGSWAYLFGARKGTEGRETQFRKAKVVRITVRTAGGDPAPGWYVSLRGAGNNVVGGPVRTDDAGLAEIPVMTRQPRLTVFLGRGADSHSGRSQGAISMDPDAPELDVTLPASQSIELAVTLNGTPGLPSSYRMLLRNDPVDAVEEDAVTGILRFELPQAERQVVALFMSAEGYVVPRIVIPAPVAGQVTRVTVDAKRAAALRVRVRPPADGHMNLTWQRQGRHDAQARSVMGIGQETVGQDGEWRIIRFYGLEPGSYRFVERMSRFFSEEVEVTSGDETSTLDLDLRRVGNATGTLDVPAGHDPSKARIHVHGEDLFPAFDGRPATRGGIVRSTGKFQVRVPGNVKVRLVPWHPLLVPATQGGIAEVTLPKNDLRLKLVEGATARFRLDPAFDPNKRVPGAPVSVLVYTGPAKGKPLRYAEPVEKDGEYLLSGIEPGTYTLVVNARFHMPVVLKDVTIADKDTDLGTVALWPGSTIRVKILVPDDQTPPRIVASAWTQEPFPYSRYINSSGEAQVLIRGLGKGTFKVNAGPSIGGARGLQKDVTVDGQSDVVVELDLR